MPALSTHNLNVTLGGYPVLQDVTFELRLQPECHLPGSGTVPAGSRLAYWLLLPGYSPS